MQICFLWVLVLNTNIHSLQVHPSCIEYTVFVLEGRFRQCLLVAKFIVQYNEVRNDEHLEYLTKTVLSIDEVLSNILHDSFVNLIDV